jgi:hypothetical protein
MLWCREHVSTAMYGSSTRLVAAWISDAHAGGSYRAKIFSSDGASLGAWWGSRPSYRHRSLRPPDPLFCGSMASALSPATGYRPATRGRAPW